MTKKQLIDILARKGHLTKKGAEEALNVILDEIMRAVAKGERVTLHGFGTFFNRRMQGRTVKVPKQNKFATIKPYRLPRFTAGEAFKRKVSK